MVEFFGLQLIPGEEGDVWEGAPYLPLFSLLKTASVHEVVATAMWIDAGNNTHPTLGYTSLPIYLVSVLHTIGPPTKS